MYCQRRRCLQCSSGHCCNSWCKEEFVLVVTFLCVSVSQILLYLPLIGAFMENIEMQWPPTFFKMKLYGNFSLEIFTYPEVARAIELLSGTALPLLCYLALPTYRQFCTKPDPDDLKNSMPKSKLVIFEELMQTTDASHYMHDIIRLILFSSIQYEERKARGQEACKECSDPETCTNSSDAPTARPKARPQHWGPNNDSSCRSRGRHLDNNCQHHQQKNIFELRSWQPNISRGRRG